MNSLYILLMAAFIIMVGIRCLLEVIDYYYKGEEGYELENEQEEPEIAHAKIQYNGHE